MTPEGKIKSDIANVLLLLERTGDVIWYERLNSLAIHQQGIHINGCRKGTPDFITTYKGKQGQVCITFIEVKTDDKRSKLSESQEKFFERYGSIHTDLTCIVARSSDEVKKYLLDRCYDRLGDIEF